MTVPARIQARPSPEQWGEDDLLSLPEAASLFWPEGPLSVSSLRVAVRDGVLPVTVVAGKILTTKRAVLSMSVCHPISGKDAETAIDEPRFPDAAHAVAKDEARLCEPRTRNPRRHR